MPRGWADIEIEPSEWFAICHDCGNSTFVQTKAEAQQWETAHRSIDHPNGSTER